MPRRVDLDEGLLALHRHQAILGDCEDNFSDCLVALELTVGISDPREGNQIVHHGPQSPVGEAGDAPFDKARNELGLLRDAACAKRRGEAVDFR